MASAALPALACGKRRPYNVLFIAIDDMNNWAGCLGGHPDALTPNLDALAAGARLFKRAYSPGTNCNGSRTAVLTGLRPWTTGIYNNRNPVAAELLSGSLPETFRSQGYKVIAGGKVFHEPQPDQWEELYLPVAPDPFQYRVAPEEYGFAADERLNWGPVRLADDKTWDGQLVAWAARQLAQEHERPLFLGVGLFEPHLPWQVPERYFQPFDPHKVALPEIDPQDLKDVPRFARLRATRGVFRQIVNSGQWPYAVASYLAAMYFSDAMLGKVLQALESGPNAGNTVVGLWSDHGFSLGQKQDWSKFLLWEHMTQVPFILRVPGMASPGTVCNRPVDLMHLYPTLCELCGVPLPEQLEGRSLRPLLDRPDAEWPLPAISTAGWGSHAVRTERWRYIRYGDGSEELYDHDSDPLERTNVAGLPEHGPLKQELATWLPEAPVAAGSR